MVEESRGEFEVAVWFRVRAATEEEAWDKVNQFCKQLKEKLGPDFVEAHVEVEK